MEQESLIKILLEMSDRKSDEALHSDPTYFEIIGRSYDEDLISRMLAYTLKTDEKFLPNILSFYFKENIYACFIDELICEKTMFGGRADLFVTAHDSSGSGYTLTIENKIYSWEHGDQTDKYFNYVSKQYKNTKNAYIFLKPEFNFSPCKNEHFKELRYSQILTMIDSQNEKVIDFKNHITKFLDTKEVEFMDIDLEVLKNYKKLKEIMKHAEEKFDAIKQQIISEICAGKQIRYSSLDDENLNEYSYLEYDPFRKNCIENYGNLSANTLVLETANYNKFIRFHRKKWYSGNKDTEDEKYYFYVELVFEDNAPDEIKVQKVIKKYGRNNSVISNFVNSLNYNSGQWWGSWFVFDIESFDSGSNEIFSNAWKGGLEDFIKESVTKAVAEMDDIFSEFESYNTKNNICEYE